MIELTRAPVRIMSPGTFPLPGFTGATYTVGHDAVLSYPWHEMPGTISCDIETAGKAGRARLDVKGVTFGTDRHSLIIDPRVPEQFKLIRDITRSGRRIVFHNSPFDVPIMYAVGLLELDSIDFVYDTLIYARLAEPDERTSKDLRNASNRHLGLKLEDPMPRILKNLGISKERWFADFDLDTPNYLFMAATDAILTSRLRPVVRADAYSRITEDHPFTMHGVTGAEADELVEREQILNRDSLRRTCVGFRADTEYADEYKRKNRDMITANAATLEQNGIRPGVSADLTGWLDEEGLIPEDYPRTPKTKIPSGRADDLKRLDHELARVFVAHKQTEKIDKDYLAKVLFDAALDGRIHPTVNLLGAATGRMSMAGPPIQQFPEDARPIIIAEDYEEVLSLNQTYYGNPKHDVYDRETKDEKVVCNCGTDMRGFASIDWSQIEPVLAANVAGDLEVLAGYENGTSDLYTDVAQFAHVARKTAKVIVLAQLYGEGILKLAKDLGLITPGEAAKITTEFKRRKKHNKECAPEQRIPMSQVAIAEELGILGFVEAVEIRNKVFGPLPKTYEYMGLLRNIGNQYRKIPTLSGRIVPIPSGWYDGEWSVQTHKAINYTFQGGAYDVLADSLLRINKAGLRDAVYFPMHDELIVDAQAAHDIRRIMETPPERLVHLIGRTPVLRTDMAHIGERWYAT